MFSWLVARTAEVMNKYKLRSDGKTSYEKITGHSCKHPVFGFGESVIWQMAPDKNNRDKLNGDFRDGIFLGIIWRTTEYLIGTPDGIFKCNTVKARPVESAYDPNCFEYIKVRYEDFVLEGAKSQGARLRFADPSVAVAIDPPIARAGNEWAPRRAYLKPADFVKHGYTVGCPGCNWIQTGLGSKRGHNEECRSRMEDSMAANADDKVRIQLQKDKMDAYAAAEGEKAIKEAEGARQDPRQRTESPEVQSS